jgi:hypothetical protein
MANAAIGIDLLAEQMIGNVHLKGRREHRFAALCRLTYDAVRTVSLADHDDEINVAQLRATGRPQRASRMAEAIADAEPPVDNGDRQVLDNGRVLQPIVEDRAGRADLKRALLIDVIRSGPTNVSPRRASNSGSSPTSSAR